MNAQWSEEIAERVSGLSPLRQELIRYLSEHHAEVSFEKRGKKTFWIFEFDQGVFQGKNRFSVRQDDLTPFALMRIIADEYGEDNSNFPITVNDAALRFIRAAREEKQED